MEISEKLPEDWSFSAVRLEVFCPHGIGHPLPLKEDQIHGCDGCCNDADGSPPEEGWEEAVNTATEEAEKQRIIPEEVQ